MHSVSIRVYLTIFAALLVLTGVTVGVAFVDLGPFNDMVAMGIAGTKATLVISYFMHVRYSSGLTKIIAMSGFFWLAVMIVFTMSDVLSRGWPNSAGW